MYFLFSIGCVGFSVSCVSTLKISERSFEPFLCLDLAVVCFPHSTCSCFQFDIDDFEAEGFFFLLLLLMNGWRYSQPL